jgi:hypothetical protein
MRSRITVSENSYDLYGRPSKYKIASVDVDHEGPVEVDISPIPEPRPKIEMKLKNLSSRMEDTKMIVEASWSSPDMPTIDLAFRFTSVKESNKLMQYIFDKLRRVESTGVTDCSIVGDKVYGREWTIATAFPVWNSDWRIFTMSTGVEGQAEEYIRLILSGSQTIYTNQMVCRFELPHKPSPEHIGKYWSLAEYASDFGNKFGFEMEDGEVGYVPPWFAEPSGRIDLVTVVKDCPRGTSQLAVYRCGNWLCYSEREAKRLNRR